MKQVTKTIDEILNNDSDCPLPLEVIPNNMGINLCSVESLTWVRQNDGQLAALAINFKPDPKENAEVSRSR